MRTQIRKVGNSAGVVIPALMLKEVNAEVGTTIELTVRDGAFIAKPVRIPRRKAVRSSITLSSLIANYVRLEDELFIKPTTREVITDEYPIESAERGKT